MFKTFSKIHLSIISFFLIKISYLLKFFKLGNGSTLPGLLLQKLPLNYLSIYFKYFDSKYIFITGTNGKTSTTALLNQLLLESGYTVLSNLTGSNLKRGILSAFSLGFNSYKRHSPNFCVFEVDEASVPGIIESFPKDKVFSLLVLNLSRDQLDRYGEIDILVDKINDSFKDFIKYNLFLKKDNYTANFNEPYFLANKDSGEFKKACVKLRLLTKDHLIENFSFIFKILKELKVFVNYEKITPFKQVPGRGNNYYFNGVKVNLNLTKNPASFNINLKQLPVESENILIYMNDNIPDGHDVSWFYDIDYELLKEALKGKNTYVAGSRSTDFFNLLNILGIPAFNYSNLNNTLLFCSSWGFKDLYILSNYSATRHLVKEFAENKNV